MLARGIRRELPLDVHVSSTTVQGYHVVYHFETSNVTTRRTWTIAHRYRAFCWLKTQLISHWTCHNERCAPVVLPCRHTFHRTCVFEWLLVNWHCPLCRKRVGPAAAATTYFRAKHSVQWWLSDFPENPLNTN
ncbi:TPA: hypothetical protein N0F65_005540 [Lagenidium giganteum]|uniref:RING-type domain-containing protein n=1 Tax=Lagenidium giganteum TaxID=4803 RepID=A0AAV2YWF2_9STRA|nr:TPA: hypothetical protein N0F65_005540 [Lagenidium giganteum]